MSDSGRGLIHLAALDTHTPVLPMSLRPKPVPPAIGVDLLTNSTGPSLTPSSVTG